MMFLATKKVDQFGCFLISKNSKETQILQFFWLKQMKKDLPTIVLLDICTKKSILVANLEEVFY